MNTFSWAFPVPIFFSPFYPVVEGSGRNTSVNFIGKPSEKHIFPVFPYILFITLWCASYYVLAWFDRAFFQFLLVQPTPPPLTGSNGRSLITVLVSLAPLVSLLDVNCRKFDC